MTELILLSILSWFIIGFTITTVLFLYTFDRKDKVKTSDAGLFMGLVTVWPIAVFIGAMCLCEWYMKWLIKSKE